MQVVLKGAACHNDQHGAVISCGLQVRLEGCALSVGKWERPTEFQRVYGRDFHAMRALEFLPGMFDFQRGHLAGAMKSG